MVGYNAAAAVASANSDIDHTSTAYPTGTYHTITNYLLNSDPESYEEDYRNIEEVDVTEEEQHCRR